MRRRPRVQTCRKNYIGRCLVCGEGDVRLLDAHRAFAPGQKYSWAGTVPLCSLCHRKAHAGRVVFHGRYLSTNGYHVLHCTVDGEERWIPDVPGG